MPYVRCLYGVSNEVSTLEERFLIKHVLDLIFDYFVVFMLTVLNLDRSRMRGSSRPSSYRALSSASPHPSSLRSCAYASLPFFSSSLYVW